MNTEFQDLPNVVSPKEVQTYQLIGEGKNNIPAQFATENSLQKEAIKKLCSDFDVSYVESYDSVQQSFIDVTSRIDTKLFTG